MASGVVASRSLAADFASGILGLPPVQRHFFPMWHFAHRLQGVLSLGPNRQFLVRPESHSSSRPYASPKLPRAGRVKDGRHFSGHRQRRLVLDASEHGGILTGAGLKATHADFKMAFGVRCLPTLRQGKFPARDHWSLRGLIGIFDCRPQYSVRSEAWRRNGEHDVR